MTPPLGPGPLGIGAYRGQIAGIVWGTAFDKVLRFGFPLLDVRTFPLNAEGGGIQRVRDAGSADGWTFGSHRFLEFRHPAIPPVDAANPYGYGDASGWDSPDGWADFLAYARTRNTLRFCPVLAAYVDGDATTYIACTLQQPWAEAPEAGWGTRRSVTVRLRATDGQFFDGY